MNIIILMNLNSNDMTNFWKKLRLCTHFAMLGEFESFHIWKMCFQGLQIFLRK